MKFNYNKPSKPLRPIDRARNTLVSQRLKITQSQAESTLENLTHEIAHALGINSQTLSLDTEFFHSSFDLLLTVNKQNKPLKK